MNDKLINQRLLRIYASRINLSVFIANLQINSKSTIPEEYHDSDFFDISPTYIPVFLKALSKKESNNYVPKEIIAIDLSPSVWSDLKSNGFYVLDSEQKIKFREQDISSDDILIFMPVFIPLSFIDAIYFPDTQSLNDSTLDLKGERFFFQDIQNKMKVGSIFSERSKEACINFNEIESPPNIEDAVSIQKLATSLSGLLYTVRKIKKIDPMLSQLYYSLTYSSKEMNFPDIMARILIEKESTIHISLKTQLIIEIFQYLLANKQLKNDIVKILFSSICGGETLDSKSLHKMDKSAYLFLNNLERFENFILANLNSNEYFLINDNSEILQGLACLHRFENYSDYYNSKNEIKEIFTRVKQSNFFYFYICFLAVQKGLKGLKIDETTFKENNEFFDWMICNYIFGQNDLFYKIDNKKFETKLLRKLIDLQFPECIEVFDGLVSIPSNTKVENEDLETDCFQENKKIEENPTKERKVDQGKKSDQKKKFKAKSKTIVSKKNENPDDGFVKEEELFPNYKLTDNK